MPHIPNEHFERINQRREAGRAPPEVQRASPQHQRQEGARCLDEVHRPEDDSENDRDVAQENGDDVAEVPEVRDVVHLDGELENCHV